MMVQVYNELFNCQKRIGLRTISGLGRFRQPAIVARRRLTCVKNRNLSRRCYGNSREENSVDKESSVDAEKEDGVSGESPGRETMTMEELQIVLDRAVEEEDYATAIEIRDRMRELEEEDPVLKLEKELKEAVEEERYEAAAKIRDELKGLQLMRTEEEKANMKPGSIEPVNAFVNGSQSAKTTSVTKTEGVVVQVESIYVPQHSSSALHKFMFAYKITITNEAHPTTIKLVARKWEITDQKGRMQLVEGQGVVGAQPILEPGESFTYQSVCPLETPRGRMKGSYEMYSRASPSGQWSTSFLVDIGEFGLDAFGPVSFERE